MMEPQRNVFCPYYGDCLDAAIENGLQAFSCIECRHRGLEDPSQDSILNCWMFLYILFQGDPKQAIRSSIASLLEKLSPTYEGNF
jgi:hypothetical protein